MAIAAGLAVREAVVVAFLLKPLQGLALQLLHHLEVARSILAMAILLVPGKLFGALLVVLQALP